MTSPNTRRGRILRGSVAPLLASFFFVACSGGTEGPVGTTSEAVSSSDPGLFQTGLTRATWHQACGVGSRSEFDDGIGCRPGPLDLCPLFDSEFIGVDGGAACAHVTTDTCPDRVDTWDISIVLNFAISVSGDCRFGQWAPPLLTASDVATYLNDLLAFTLQFFGCPEEPGTTGPLTFGLIPAALAGDRFTTADLDALSDAYFAAVQQALADNGSPPLTNEQAFLVQSKLHRLARRVPNTAVSPQFNFSTCAADAGAPAPVPFADDVTCF